MFRPPQAFTLIELLIVVAIIAVLAAIAMVNFQDSQARSKVARVRSDLRTVSVAIDSYRVDQGAYPRQGPPETCNIALNGIRELTTPIGYITTFPMDVFPEKGRAGKPYLYGVCNSDSVYYYLWSIGPDLKNNHAEFLYDPTNGTASAGDIKRTTARDAASIAVQ